MLLIIMKRTLLLLAISVWMLTGCKQNSSTTEVQNENAFSFAFLTDIHLQPELSAEAGFQWAINEVNKRNPDFVITGGDLVMDVLNQSYGGLIRFTIFTSSCRESLKCPYTIPWAITRFTDGTGMKRELRNTRNLERRCLKNVWAIVSIPSITRAGISLFWMPYPGAE